MIRLRLGPARVRVSVFDESPDPPVAAQPTAGAIACWGRGLALVAEMADAWGVADERAGRFAKGVWFELGGFAGVPPVRLSDLSSNPAWPYSEGRS
ncbi:ATP-binding protein [Streptomyces sp. NPDC101455]|uniref:ATP-binding protein n=1 Tax=Streptomyces sp. NPDC101455 TaxID=3366142 RepID=UPI0038036826